jgi:hypothetical protein
MSRSNVGATNGIPMEVIETAQTLAASVSCFFC